MLGNYDRDPDRFVPMLAIACDFLKSLGYGEEPAVLDGLLNEPENAHTLLAAGEPDEIRPAGRLQRAALNAWVERWSASRSWTMSLRPMRPSRY